MALMAHSLVISQPLSKDTAGLVFGPANNLFVVNSGDPGSVTVLNATTFALITIVNAGGILMILRELPSAPTEIFTSPMPVATTSSSSTEPPALSSQICG
jgi:hypothetical protein